jgi:cytochrome c oxidase subunit 4
MAIEHATGRADHHPGPRQYLVVGAILAVLTGLEVGAFFLTLSSAVVVFILLALTASKFVLVVAFFMHLKFDNRLFTWLLVFPFVVMVSTLIALMALLDTLTR